MPAGPPSLTRVGVRFILTLIAAMAFWIVFLEPGYDRFVSVIGSALLHAVESPPRTGAVRVDSPYAFVSHVGPATELKEQRLELRTHHNNAPLLAALILATPGLTHARRERTLLIAFVLLAVTHILHFMLAVQYHYAVENVGPFRVTDLRYLGRGFWQSLDNSAQTAKVILIDGLHFYEHVGRLVTPILIWMVLCRDALVPYTRAARAETPT